MICNSIVYLVKNISKINFNCVIYFELLIAFIRIIQTYTHTDT